VLSEDFGNAEVAAKQCKGNELAGPVDHSGFPRKSWIDQTVASSPWRR